MRPMLLPLQLLSQPALLLMCLASMAWSTWGCLRSTTSSAEQHARFLQQAGAKADLCIHLTGNRASAGNHRRT